MKLKKQSVEEQWSSVRRGVSIERECIASTRERLQNLASFGIDATSAARPCISLGNINGGVWGRLVTQSPQSKRGFE